jgi:hypothetical protein
VSISDKCTNGVSLERGIYMPSCAAAGTACYLRGGVSFCVVALLQESGQLVKTHTLHHIFLAPEICRRWEAALGSLGPIHTHCLDDVWYEH